MATERGLPSIPRNVGRDMRVYLQGLHSVVASLAGLGRNTQESRAVRYRDGSLISGGSSSQQEQNLSTDAVQTENIAEKAVTSEKLADKSVTSDKLAMSAVTSRAIAAGAVGQNELATGAVFSDKIADGQVTASKLGDNAVGTAKIKDNAVTLDKLAGDVLPVSVDGVADHGATVDLGAWLEAPTVAVTGLAVAVEGGGTLRASIENLRQGEGGQWEFDAVACLDMGENEAGEPFVVPGQITWRATGRRASNAG